MNTPLNILVVEDHDDLREATHAALASMGHTVRSADCPEAMDEALTRFRADILLLDLNLPGEDGLSIARRQRAAQPAIGIIMVTACNQVMDRMTGYGSGADIYLTKPSSSEELGAAIQALSRRLIPHGGDTAQLTLNLATMQLQGARSQVDLSDTECSVLLALSRAVDHRLENWQLMELSGKSPDDFNKSALEALIVRLRKKLERAGAAAPTIKAIRGVGYQLCSPPAIRKA